MEGASATAPSHSASQRMESIKGSLRPHRSATAPAATPPTSRTSSVSVMEPASTVTPTPNSLAISGITSR